MTLAAACKPADYEDYTGWAYGVNFAPSAAQVEAKYSAIVFEDSKRFLQKKWNAAAATNLLGGTSTTTPTATAPIVADLGTPAATLNYFTGFGGKSTTGLAVAQFAFALQKTDDTIYYEADDTVNIWNLPSNSGVFADATAATAGDATTKYAMTALVMVGAASLTATAASVIVASLLF